MSATIQPELIPATDPNWKAPKDELAPVTPMALMQVALERGQVEQLQILQEMYFKDMACKAEIDFNQAMNAIQGEIGRVAPDLQNPQTSSKYASYKALDKILRPVYTRHGLSLSFSEEDCPKPDHVRMICYVSKGLHTRIYRKDMPVDNKGIKGNVMMTPTHATATADSYGKRYLLKDIFNVAIGEDDTDGNAPMSGADVDVLQEWIDSIEESSTFEELQQKFTEAYRANTNQTARDAIIAAKDRHKKKLLAKAKGAQ